MLLVMTGGGVEDGPGRAGLGYVPGREMGRAGRWVGPGTGFASSAHVESTSSPARYAARPQLWYRPPGSIGYTPVRSLTNY